MTSLEVIRFFWLRHVWTHWFFRQPGLFWTYIIPTSIYGNSEIDCTAHSRFHSDLWICPCAEGMIGTSGAKNWVWGGPFFQWWPYPNKHNKFYSLNHTSFLIRQQWKNPFYPHVSPSLGVKKKKYLGATATGPTSVYLVIIRQHSWFKKKTVSVRVRIRNIHLGIHLGCCFERPYSPEPWWTIMENILP